MHLTILAPEGVVFEGDVQQVTLPGSLGKVQILRNHAPFTSLLQEGTMTYGDAQHERTLAIKKGWVEVRDNRITAFLT